MQILAQDSDDDFLTLTVGTNGATTLATIDTAGADAHFSLSLDGEFKLARAGATGVLRQFTNSQDLAFQQFDGTEVARVHDGAVVPTASGTSTSLSAGTGFGNRRRVLTLGSGNDDNDLTLTAVDSGAVIYITPTNAVDVILPVVATETGIWFDIIIASNVNKAITIKTGGDDNNDNITLHNIATDATSADVGAADHDRLQITNALAGTRIELINCAGGSNEKWHAYVRTMDTVDAAVA